MRACERLVECAAHLVFTGRCGGRHACRRRRHLLLDNFVLRFLRRYNRMTLDENRLERRYALSQRVLHLVGLPLGWHGEHGARLGQGLRWRRHISRHIHRFKCGMDAVAAKIGGRIMSVLCHRQYSLFEVLLWTNGEHVGGINGCGSRCECCGGQLRALRGEAEGLEESVGGGGRRDSRILILDGLEHQRSLRIIY